MKIGQPTDLSASVVQTNPPAAQKASLEPAASAKSSAASASVSVSVSNLARALEKPDLSQVADVDSAKVAAVKAAIEDGSYEVNAEAIADKLLSNAQEMLVRAR
jgi:negative regulator of flagellin synthesis FlgM